MTDLNWDGHEWDPAGSVGGSPVRPEPTPEFPLPDTYLQDAHEAIDRYQDWERKYEQFVLQAKDVHGPIGELVRDIIAQFADFRRQELMGHTTVGEGNRWDPVIESEMGVVSWLDGTDLS